MTHKSKLLGVISIILGVILVFWGKNLGFFSRFWGSIQFFGGANKGHPLIITDDEKVNEQK